VRKTILRTVLLFVFAGQAIAQDNSWPTELQITPKGDRTTLFGYLTKVDGRVTIAKAGSPSTLDGVRFDQIDPNLVEESINSAVVLTGEYKNEENVAGGERGYFDVTSIQPIDLPKKVYITGKMIVGGYKEKKYYISTGLNAYEVQVYADNQEALWQSLADANKIARVFLTAKINHTGPFISLISVLQIEPFTAYRLTYNNTGVANPGDLPCLKQVALVDGVENVRYAPVMSPANISVRDFDATPDAARAVAALSCITSVKSLEPERAATGLLYNID
jgi:hypothetical protein